jgi:hypothetical protein
MVECKPSFSQRWREGGAEELKKRFSVLRVNIYDARQRPAKRSNLLQPDVFDGCANQIWLLRVA